jgi:transcriptional regulator with XRE-family HTH domain
MPMGHAPSAVFRLRSVEARRLGIGLSIEKLCGLAGIASSGYRNALAGKHQVSDAVLVRLSMALSGRAHVEPFTPPPPPRPLLRAAYEAFHVGACRMVGVDDEKARAVEPGRGGIELRFKAGLARRIAIYALGVKFNLTGPTIADIAGVTKESVRLAIQAVEEERDRKDFSEALDRMVGGATGETGGLFDARDVA